MTAKDKQRNTEPESGMTQAGGVVRIARGLWSLAREVRHLPDRMRHSSRRARAQDRLARSAPFRAVLFICHGNVCRSPYAAARFVRLTQDLGLRVVVESAGFVGPGRASPSAALAVAARRNTDMTAHRSQLVTRELVAAADLIVVMSAEQAVTMGQDYGPLRGTLLVLGDLDPARITRRTILDPWGGALSMFDESYERIDRCLRELVRLHAASVPNAPQC